MLVFYIIVIIAILLFIFRPKEEKYELIDIARDVCRIGCLSRGNSHEYCFDYNNPFSRRCIPDVIGEAGRLPKNIHMEDIYDEYYLSK